MTLRRLRIDIGQRLGHLILALDDGGTPDEQHNDGEDPGHVESERLSRRVKGKRDGAKKILTPASAMNSVLISCCGRLCLAHATTGGRNAVAGYRYAEADCRSVAAAHFGARP